MAKHKHYVDTDKIYHVELIERRGKTYIRFSAKIDGKKQEIELTEDAYGKMLQSGYYES
jgi:hypothetical protein